MASLLKTIDILNNDPRPSQAVVRYKADKKDRAPSKPMGARARLALLVLGDLLAITAASVASLSWLMGFHSNRPEFAATLGSDLGFLLLYAALILLFCHTQDLYSTSRRPLKIVQECGAVARALTMTCLLLETCIYISHEELVSLLVLLVATMGSFLTMTGWRAGVRTFLRTTEDDGAFGKKVLLIGTDRVAASLQSYLDRRRSPGVVVVGCVAGLNERVSARHRYLGDINELAAICHNNFVDEVIVCAQSPETLRHIVAECQASGTSVRVIPDFYDQIAPKSPMENLGPFPSILLRRKTAPAAALRAKRALDFSIALAALILLAPLLAAIAIWVKLDSPGPVFYGAMRVGRKGRLLRCHKFRTMVQDAEQLKGQLMHLNERDGVLFKISNDPRVTSAGRFLRKYSLDELPQLWNVVKGEMSMVGPRPPLATEVQNYQAGFLRRLEVRPGITGLWQVEARQSSSFDEYIQLDLQYVERRSLLLDLKIIAKTFAVVFAGTGQ